MTQVHAVQTLGLTVYENNCPDCHCPSDNNSLLVPAASITHRATSTPKPPDQPPDSC